MKMALEKYKQNRTRKKMVNQQKISFIIKLFAYLQIIIYLFLVAIDAFKKFYQSLINLPKNDSEEVA